MEKKEIRNYQIGTVEIRTDEEAGKKLIRGYAVEWDKLSLDLGWFREKIDRHAFDKSLQDGNQKAYWNHNTDLVLGSTKSGTLKLEADNRGLYYEIDAPDSPAGENARVAIERGDVDGTSFGFWPTRVEWDETDPENPIRTILEGVLDEISPTPRPAYEGASSASYRSTEDVYAEHRQESQQESTEEAQESRENSEESPIQENGNKIELEKLKLIEMEI